MFPLYKANLHSAQEDDTWRARVFPELLDFPQASWPEAAMDMAGRYSPGIQSGNLEHIY